MLCEEVLNVLAPREGERVIDLTVGAGGHARAMWERMGRRGVLVGVDRDPAILTIARARLAQEFGQDQIDSDRRGEGVRVHQGDFGDLPALRSRVGDARFDVMLADLGVSSLQLDDPERGFSFRVDGPLDMRMDPTSPLDAQSLLASASPDEIAHWLRNYGEERFARKIADAIVRVRRHRPLVRTGELASLVRSIVPPSRERSIDVATRTFQALRIAVNDELGALERLLRRFGTLLAPGGRIGVISFHSLEDRLVKNAFRERVAQGDHRLLTRGALRPSSEEVRRNPRSRSARLRALAHVPRARRETG